MIDQFRGKYFFLSNFYKAPVGYGGYTFCNNEAAFQAAKCPGRAGEFCQLNPSDAKRLGRRVYLRKDWEQIKERIMYKICKCKFMQNDDLRRLLLETGEHELVEGNTWGDRVWGICDGIGENRLGKILMKIRAELSTQ